MTLNEAAARLRELDVAIKKAEAERSTLREYVFGEATREWTGRTLPRKLIEIEHGFWQKTGLDEDRFFSTRFPSWQIIARKEENEGTSFILERDPSYLPWSWVDEDTHIRLARQVQEFTPEFDWLTLERERPELFAAISRPKIVHELDEQKFQQICTEKPEVVPLLTRHLMARTPVRKLGPIKEVKDYDEFSGRSGVDADAAHA